MQVLLHFLKSFISFFRHLPTKVLGNFSYQAPPWLTRLAGFKRNHPGLFWKRLGGYGGGLVLLIAAFVGGKIWWDSRPVPDYVDVKIEALRPMDLETKTVAPLKVYFSKSTAKVTDLNKVLNSGIHLKPEMKGAWSWSTDRLLVFIPAKDQPDWAVGQTYTLSFDRDFFPTHLIFKSRDWEFSTEKLESSVVSHSFYIDPRNPDIKKAAVTFRFNYPVQGEEVRKRVQFELQNQGISLSSSKVPFTMAANKYQTEFYFLSENLKVPTDSQKMVITLAKGVKAIAGGPASDSAKDVSVAIPSRYEALRVDSSQVSFARNERYEPEQILVIRTTTEARSEDVAKNLNIRLLPLDRPASEGEAAVPRYQWQSASELNPEILGKSETVKFKVVPSADEWSRIHTFSIQTEPERGLFVEVKAGLHGLGGYELKDPYEAVVSVSAYPQELSIMSQGAILTLTGDLKLPMLARNVGQVEFTLHRILPEQVNHLMMQLGGNISKPGLPYGLETQIAEKFQSNMSLKIESAKSTQYFSFDLAPFISKGAGKGIFLLIAKAKNPDKTDGVEDRRLVMVTDMGLLVKETVGGNSEVFVQNFRTGLPVEGASVEVVGTNGLAVLKATTDAMGHAVFPDLKEFKNEKHPVALSVRRGDDQSFLPFRNYQQRLQYSRFDIGGVYESSSSDQLISMLFSDRGIYRPGEAVNLGLILRSKKGKSAAKKPVLEWVVTDPKGAEVLREKVQLSSSDMKDLHFSTESTSPTGVYDIRIYLVKKELPQRELEQIGSESVKVEEFQPDRLKIQLSLSPQKSVGWITPQEMKAQISLRNMFGTAAEDRLVRAELVVSPTTPVFRDYKEFSFTDLNSKDEQVYTETLGETRSNAKGEAEIVFDMTKYKAALFNMRVNAEGFASEGGRSVKALASALVSPLKFIVGYKADGDLNYLKLNSERNLQLIALNSDLKMIETGEVRMVTIERKYTSVLTLADDGTYKYQSVFKETPLSEKEFAIGSKGAAFKVDTSKAGDFSLVFRNADKMDILKINYSVVGSENLTRSLEKTAELKLSLNKSDFKNGEDIEMQIKAPYKGSGLISIERDGVYATKWFKTTGSTTIEKIKVPQGLDGNAYVNVTFLRAIDSEEIYTSPLSYAVAPFSISLDEHKTLIQLDAPAKVKPGQKLKIKYSANKKTDIILYGVDEGILQVARYKLPQPLGFFFQKRALQVTTYQMLDLLLPEFSILQQTQAAGGDEGAGALGKNLNPFKSKRVKPVVFWSGVITADPTTKTYTYDVPDSFNGNMKIMAVAAGPQGLGAAQIDAIVRGDLIMTPNVPVFVSPNDEFSIGISVSNQTEGSGDKAKVKLETNVSSHLQVVQGKTQELEIPEGREVGTEVQVKALNQLGVADLQFVATLNQAKAQVKMDTSVRPGVPYMNSLQVGLFEGQDVTLPNSRMLFAEYAQDQVTASGSPFVLLKGLLNYLETYPYGCTEQVIAKAMPALVLRTQAEFFPQKDKAQENFKKSLQILASRQRSDGGFALYSAAEAASNPAASLFAIQYLIEAKTRGLNPSEEMLRRGKAYLGAAGLRASAADLRSARRWAQSLYLDARMGTVNGASLAQLRRELEAHLKGKWEKDIVAIHLAGVYALYKQDEKGEKIMSDLELGQPIEVDFEDYVDPTVRDSTLLMVAAKHFPTSLKNLVAAKKIESLMKPINQGLYHSHSVATLILAFDAISSSSAVQTALAQLQLEVSKEGKWTSQESPSKQPKLWNLALNTGDVKLTGGQGPLFYSRNVGGFDQKPVSVKKNIEVGRQYLDKAGKEVSKVQIGDEITVRLQVRTLDQGTYQHLAMVELIPAGFELISEARNANLGSQSVDQEASPGGPPGDGNLDEGHGDEVEGAGEEGAMLRWLVPQILPQAYAQATSLSPLNTNFVDEREDRLVFYFSADGNLSEYKYRMKAINKGRFTVAPPFAEGMYNRGIQFLGEASTIEVVGK